MNTLEFIYAKYNLAPNKPGRAIEIPNMGRDDLAVLFKELEFKAGAEIGIERGVYSEVLLKSNPGLLLHCVDAWQAYKGYRDHVSQEKLDRFYEETKKRLKPYNANIIRGFSTDVLNEMPLEDGTLDFVYIDANHELEFVLTDIIRWSRKVRKGGIVAGHDYYKSSRHNTKNHTVHAVHAYVNSYHIDPWFLIGSKDIVDGQTRDHSRSWMWVKE